MWLPGNGAFYSPFGWGFYGPGLVAYAPVMGVPYYGGYGYGAGYYPVTTGKPVKAPTTTTAQLTVPVNPNNVGVSSFTATSPAALNSARIQMQNYTSFYGLRTASGAAPAIMRNGTSFSSMQAASHAAAASAREASASHASSGGWSSSSGGFASAAPATASLGGGGSGMSSMSRGSSASSGGGHAK
jgi:hypothetical protein